MDATIFSFLRVLLLLIHEIIIIVIFLTGSKLFFHIISRHYAAQTAKYKANNIMFYSNNITKGKPAMQGMTGIDRLNEAIHFPGKIPAAGSLNTSPDALHSSCAGYPLSDKYMPIRIREN